MSLVDDDDAQSQGVNSVLDEILDQVRRGVAHPTNPRC